MKRKIHKVSFDVIDKIHQSLLKGNTFEAVQLECGNPPRKLISWVMKEKLPETVGMDSRELQAFRNKLYEEYIQKDLLIWN